MLVSEFLQKLGREPLPPVLLFCPGKAPFNREDWEPFLAERAIERLVAMHLDPSMHDLAYTVFYAEETEPGAVVMEAETMPFLAERRVVLVRNAGRYMKMSADKKSPLAPLLAYLQRPLETTLLILVSAEVDRRVKLYTACGAAGMVIESPQLDERALAAWIRGEVEGKGKTIAAGAIDEIARRAGARLSDVHNAIELLLGYVGEGPEIREEDVITACADVAEESVWNLTDAIAASKPERALHALHQLLDFGKSPDEIMGTINWLLESAYKAAPESQLNVQSRFVAEKVRPLAAKLGFAKLKEALSLCTRTQFMLRSTGVDRDLALELLVIKLAAPRRRRPQGAAARR